MSIKQIESGDIRVLATSGDKRIEGIDAPTLKESGIDLVFTNWRGIVAPPGISDADKAPPDRRLREDARDPGLEGGAEDANSWTDAFLTGDEFRTFLDRAGQAGGRHPDRAWPGVTSL